MFAAGSWNGASRAGVEWLVALKTLCLIGYDVCSTTVFLGVCVTTVIVTVPVVFAGCRLFEGPVVGMGIITGWTGAGMELDRSAS